jgi:hypothetical protein
MSQLGRWWIGAIEHDPYPLRCAMARRLLSVRMMTVDVSWLWFMLGLGCAIVLAWLTVQVARRPSQAEKQLERRYARGEIDWDEYDRRRRVLHRIQAQRRFPR